MTKGKKRVSKPVPGGVKFTKFPNACKLCRRKKVKCDQGYPSCKGCLRNNVPCVSVDPVTGQDIPRSYVFFLEDSLSNMMSKLSECGINPMTIKSNVPCSENDTNCNLEEYKKKFKKNGSLIPVDDMLGSYLVQKGMLMQDNSETSNGSRSDFAKSPSINSPMDQTYFRSPKPMMPQTASPMESSSVGADLEETNNHFSDIGSMKETTKNSYLGDSSGVSFAKLVYTAANFQPDYIDSEFDEDIKLRELKYRDYALAENDPNFDPLALPPIEEAEQLINRFFIDTNSQLPVFHREQFLKKYYEPIYGEWNNKITLVSNKTKINRNFMGPEPLRPNSPYGVQPWYNTWKSLEDKGVRDIELHDYYRIPYFVLNMVFTIGCATKVLASDIKQVVTFKRRATHFKKDIFSSTDRLEALMGTLLLAIYSIMRPNVPGVWYTMGSVLRLTVDLGLHSEKINMTYDPFTREIRRRLFWCVYSLDRQVCSYFGRPFGIPEDTITTGYPSLLPDSEITPAYGTIEDYSDVKPKSISYKKLAIAMFAIRQLQAKIVRVLYAPHAEIPRKYNDLEEWRAAVHSELNAWYDKAVPRSQKMIDCHYNSSLFELNYHYTKSILYGLSPKCPILTELSCRLVFLSTKGTIDVFYDLCINQKIGYTWVAVHNVFMAGMTYLYVIFYSGNNIKENRQEVEDYTGKILFILKNLIGTCEAAKNCFQSYDVLSKVVIKLKFGEKIIEDNSSKENTFKSGGNLQIDDSKNTDLLKRKPSISGGSLDLPLEKFFLQLDKLEENNDEEPSNTGKFRGRSMSFLNNNNNNNNMNNGNKDTGINLHNEQDFQNDFKLQDDLPLFDDPANEEQNMVDILFQVTSQSLWDEFFVKQNNEEKKEENIDPFFTL